MLRQIFSQMANQKIKNIRKLFHMHVKAKFEENYCTLNGICQGKGKGKREFV